MTPQQTHHETADTYHGEIVRRGMTRAAICKDGVQYIIQRQRKSGGGKWDAYGYCTTKKALTRLWRGADQAVPAEITSLPDRARDYSALNSNQSLSVAPDRRAA